MVSHKVQAMFERKQRNAELRERLVTHLAGPVWQTFSEQAGVTRDVEWRKSVAQECVNIADALIHELAQRNQTEKKLPAARLEEVRADILREYEYQGRAQGRLNELQAEARRLEAQLDSQT